MNDKLKIAYIKLDELMSGHKQHFETRNHYFTDMYNALQRRKSQTESTDVLKKAFAN